MLEGFELSGGSRRFYKGFRVFALALFRVWTRLEIRGSENVPETGGFVFAPGGHRSLIDTPASAVASPRLLRFMGAEDYFSVKGLGWALRAVGGFPVQRGTTDRAALRLAEEVLRSGEPLVVFPEATRFSGSRVRPFKEGAMFLASRAQVPVIPVGLGGGERAWPKGKFLIRPRKMVIIVGEPLQPPAAAEGTRVKRSQIKAATNDLHERIQTLFDEAQVAAGAD